MLRKAFGMIGNRLRLAFAEVRGLQAGQKCKLGRHCEITRHSGVSIGNNSILYRNVIIYNGKKGFFAMGDNSHVAPYGYFLVSENKVTIGNDVAVGPFCSFFCHSNAAGSKPLFRENYLDADIRIGSNVFVGAQCVFLPGSTVGDNVVIAANSTIKGNLEGGFMYGGSPAVALKPINQP